MVYKIIMPKAGMSMEEGKIINWLVKEGDKVTQGDPLLEIETDKTSMEVEATASGTIIKITAQEGDIIPVTHIIGYIGTLGEIIKDEVEVEAKELKVEDHIVKDKVFVMDKSSRIYATPLAKTLAKQKNLSMKNISPSGFWGEIKARDVLAAGKIRITPLARKIAEKEGIKLEKPPAENGRIYSEYVIELLKKASATRSTGCLLTDEDIQKPLSGMRRTIGDRMMASHIEIPPVTLDTKADVTGLLLERQKQNSKGGEKISINDYVMYACAQSLSAIPNMNCSFAGDSIKICKYVNIGVAVALDEGLIVPVVKDAAHLSLEEMSQSIKELADKAKKGKLSLDEYTGGTFTVSNLGMYGITFFTPIINQPESMILGVCAIEKVVKMLKDGILVNRDIMGLSLTFDHRVHDGASASVFLKKIVEMLEGYNGNEEVG